jgi:hypothetical protein
MWTRGHNPPGPDCHDNHSVPLTIPRLPALSGLNGVNEVLATPLSPLYAPRPVGVSDRHRGSDLLVRICTTGAGRGDPARFHDVVVARRGEGEPDVLFDQQD